MPAQYLDHESHRIKHTQYDLTQEQNVQKCRVKYGTQSCFLDGGWWKSGIHALKGYAGVLLLGC